MYQEEIRRHFFFGLCNTIFCYVNTLLTVGRKRVDKTFILCNHFHFMLHIILYPVWLYLLLLFSFFLLSNTKKRIYFKKYNRDCDRKKNYQGLFHSYRQTTKNARKKKSFINAQVFS